MAVEDTQHEMRAHARTYELFLKLIKWGVILSALTGLVVVLLIAN